MPYKWRGMQKISYRVAVELCKTQAIQLYLLYEDNTESAVERLEDIEKHHEYGGEFGFEKAREFPENKEGNTCQSCH